MKYVIIFILCFVAGCATCEYAETHKFLNKNSDFFQEVCYIVHSPPEEAGEYCTRIKK